MTFLLKMVKNWDCWFIFPEHFSMFFNLCSCWNLEPNLERIAKKLSQPTLVQLENKEPTWKNLMAVMTDAWKTQIVAIFGNIQQGVDFRELQLFWETGIADF